MNHPDNFNPRHGDFLGPKTPIAEKPGEEDGEPEQVGLSGVGQKAPSYYDA